jgi:GntR family transcriptional regulator
LTLPNIELDFRSEAPIYEQIVTQVRGWISRGLLKPGDQLPTVRQLAMELRVNFNTVARAYRMLDEARLISTQRGRGTYILAETEHEAPDVTRHKALASLAAQYLRETSRLGFAPEEAISALRESQPEETQGSSAEPGGFTPGQPNETNR